MIKANDKKVDYLYNLMQENGIDTWAFMQMVNRYQGSRPKMTRPASERIAHEVQFNDELSRWENRLTWII